MSLDDSYTITLECVGTDQLITKLTSDVSTSSRTVMGIGGQRVSSAMLGASIVPSMPMYQSGLKMIVAKIHSESYWTFFLPVSWEVALIYFAIIVAVSGLVWVMEERSWNKRKITHAFNYLELIYDVFSGFFFTNLIHLRKVSSRIVLWFFWFTTFVFIALYQANLSQKISESYTFNKIKSFKQGLNDNYRFGMLESFDTQMGTFYPNNVNQFSFYSTSTVASSILTMFSDLENGKIDGLVLESPLAEYFDSLYCTTDLIDGLIWSFNYVQAFASGTTSARLTEYNSKLSKSKQSLPVSDIKQDVFDTTGMSLCQPTAEKIRTSELAGLWIILGISLTVSLIVWGLQKLLKVNVSKHIAPPRQKFENKKNDEFEEALKENIKKQIQEILKAQKSNFIRQIDIFERTLMLQEDFQEEETVRLASSLLHTKKDLETEADLIGKPPLLISQESDRIDTSQ